MRGSTTIRITILVLLSAFVWFSTVDAQAEKDILEFMMSYFELLKNGNVKELAAMLTGPMLDSKKLLLEQNSAYPEYLKKYYKDATMRVIDISQSENLTKRVSAKIFFKGDDHPLKSQFLLKFEGSTWKIEQELILP